MKTAVLELIEFIKNYKNQTNFNVDLIINLLEKTLEKEKEQIIDAFEYGQINVNEDGCITEENGAEQYYNQTYNQNNGE